MPVTGAPLAFMYVSRPDATYSGVCAVQLLACMTWMYLLMKACGRSRQHLCQDGDVKWHQHDTISCSPCGTDRNSWRYDCRQLTHCICSSRLSTPKCIAQRVTLAPIKLANRMMQPCKAMCWSYRFTACRLTLEAGILLQPQVHAVEAWPEGGEAQDDAVGQAPDPRRGQQVAADLLNYVRVRPAIKSRTASQPDAVCCTRIPRARQDPASVHTDALVIRS